MLPESERGRELAGAMIAAGASAGLPIRALLTDMSQPLARSAGNALEVREAIAMLRGERTDARLLEVTLALGAEVMMLGKLAKDPKSARTALARSITSGGAAERFARMVVSLGGPKGLVEKPDAHLASAPVIVDVTASGDGFVTGIDTRAIGFAVVRLGGGRTSPEQSVDHAVGLDRLLSVGATVQKGQPIARVHAANRAAANEAAAAVAAAFSLGDQAPAAAPLVERID